MIAAQHLVRSTPQELPSSHLHQLSDSLRSPADSCKPSMVSRFSRVAPSKPLNDRNYPLKNSQVFYFNVVTNSLPLPKILTPLQSSKSELLCKTTRGGGTAFISPLATRHSPLPLTPLSTAFTTIRRLSPLSTAFTINTGGGG